MPTKPGYYWYRERDYKEPGFTLDDGWQVRAVFDSASGVLWTENAFDRNGPVRQVTDARLSGEWGNRISLPEDAPVVSEGDLA